MAGQYWKRRCRRAGSDTLDFFGWNRRGLVFPALWIVGAAIYWGLTDWQSVVSEVLVSVAFGLIPVGGFALLLLAYNWIRAPAKMQAEAETRGDELEGQLQKIRNKQEHVDHLSELLSEGIHTIWNAPVNNDAELAALDAHCNDWHARVVAYLTDHFNQADVDHFNRLGVVPLTARVGTYPGTGNTSGQHERILRHYALQEQRLREVVRDHNVTHV